MLLASYLHILKSTFRNHTGSLRGGPNEQYRFQPPGAAGGIQMFKFVFLYLSRHLFVGFFTFKEDKFSVRPLVGGVDARRQALPEVIDLHGVTFLHLVVPQTPEPPVLQHNQGGLDTSNDCLWKKPARRQKWGLKVPHSARIFPSPGGIFPPPSNQCLCPVRELPRKEKSLSFSSFVCYTFHKVWTETLSS